MSEPQSPALLACLFACIVAGCAEPTSHQGLGQQPFRPLDAYLNDIERRADCNGLKLAMGRRAAEVKRLEGAMTEELKKPAPTIERMVKRSDGTEGRGTLAYDSIVAERRSMQTINARLEAKHCAPIDIGTAIAAATAAAAPAKACADGEAMKPAGAPHSTVRQRTPACG